MELILGTAGQPHVTSQQMREIFKMVVGSGSYILNSGEYIEPELQSNQALRIRSGILMHHGGIAEVKQNTYDEVTIGNGTQGMKRIDLVVARYTKDPETEHETMTWVAIQGTPAASDPVAPAYTEGDMQNGDLTDDCPVFEVHLDGIQVTEVVKLVEILDCDLSSLNGKTKKYEATVNTTQGSYIHFARIGNLVCATHIAVFSLPSANVSHIIATIPSGYRPDDNVYATEVLVTSDAITGNGRWSFGNNGDIRLIASTTTIAEHSLTLCYLTDDAFPDN